MGKQTGGVTKNQWIAYRGAREGGRNPITKKKWGSAIEDSKSQARMMGKGLKEGSVVVVCLERGLGSQDQRMMETRDGDRRYNQEGWRRSSIGSGEEKNVHSPGLGGRVSEEFGGSGKIGRKRGSRQRKKNWGKRRMRQPCFNMMIKKG